MYLNVFQTEAVNITHLLALALSSFSGGRSSEAEGSFSGGRSAEAEGSFSGGSSAVEGCDSLKLAPLM